MRLVAVQVPSFAHKKTRYPSVDWAEFENLPAGATYSLDELGRWHDDWLPTPGMVNRPEEPGLLKIIVD